MRITKQLGKKENAVVNGPESDKPIDSYESRNTETTRS